MKSDLKIDWASYEAAKFAVCNWHYSGAMPVGKLVKIGAWEKGKFIGVVLFGRGANNNMSKPYRLRQDQACELVRVALRDHKASVSRIVRIALSFLKRQSPSLQLIVSYADPDQGHYGGIYQAGGWLYRGITHPSDKFWHNDRWVHAKTIHGIDRSRLKKKTVQGKHIYLMPFTKAMKKQIESMSKPYPKRASTETSDTLGGQPGESGATPTDALHTS